MYVDNIHLIAYIHEYIYMRNVPIMTLDFNL